MATSILSRAELLALAEANIPDSPGVGGILPVAVRGSDQALAKSLAVLAETEIRVVNMTTTAPPASPADRAAYVIASGATGAWSGKVGQIAVADESESPSTWFYIDPPDGMQVLDLSQHRRHRWDTSGSPGEWVSISRYDFGVQVGATPADGAILYRQTAVMTEYLPANLAGSRGALPDTLPGASFVMTLQVVDDTVSPQTITTLGTVTISTAGAYTFATDGGTAKTITPGQELQVVAPSASPTEASLAGFSFTILRTASDL